LFEKKNLGV
jgi:hypothetical protein